MQFSDTTNKNLGIIQNYEMRTGLGDTSVSGAAYRLQEATAYANEAANKVEGWIHEVDKMWRYGDSNLASFAMATTTLVADQRDYTSTFAKILDVEVMDAAGNYSKLIFDPRLLTKQSSGKWQETAGLPTHYYLFNGSIILYPKPAAASVTLALGLRVTYEPSADLFTVADTTQTPGFHSRFHTIIPIYMTMTWAGINKLWDLHKQHKELIYGGESDKGLKRELQRHYSQPTEDFVPVIGDNYNKTIRHLVK